MIEEIFSRGEIQMKQHEQIQFIPAGIDDLPRIVDIYNSTIPSRLVTADIEPVSIESRLTWFHAHTPEKRPIFIIKGGDAINGWISFESFYGRPAYAKTAEVSIYLDASVRGKGVGTAALGYVISKCPSLGIENLLAFIFGHNKASIRLFQKFEFEQWALLPEVAELDGIKRDLVILGRKVKAAE